jgi:hypothetical protein
VIHLQQGTQPRKRNQFIVKNTKYIHMYSKRTGCRLAINVSYFPHPIGKLRNDTNRI